MIFSLEALESKQGDALLLHFGEEDSPELAIIDGGPSGVYGQSLRPRLEQLRGVWQDRERREGRSGESPLPIRLLMVSHIDDDHIKGVLDMTKKLVELRQQNQPLPYAIETLWHNSFDDILGNRTDEVDALSAALAPAVKAASSQGFASTVPLKQEGAAVVASVNQGRRLRDDAHALGLKVNAPFQGLVARPTQGKRVVSLGKLKLIIVGPSQERVNQLQGEWDEQIKKSGVAKAAAFVDESVFNLSSIVVLAQVGNKRMLLTGDARGDDILAGLQATRLLKKGQIHLDLLKLPHHGSDRNVSTDFFRQVTADHYVVSGDGKHGNPEIATLQMLSAARGQEEYTLYLTNQEPRLTEFFAGEKANGKKYLVRFRADNQRSIRVNLD